MGKSGHGKLSPWLFVHCGFQVLQDLSSHFPIEVAKQRKKVGLKYFYFCLMIYQKTRNRWICLSRNSPKKVGSSRLQKQRESSRVQHLVSKRKYLKKYVVLFPPLFRQQASIKLFLIFTKKLIKASPCSNLLVNSQCRDLARSSPWSGNVDVSVESETRTAETRKAGGSFKDNVGKSQWGESSWGQRRYQCSSFTRCYRCSHFSSRCKGRGRGYWPRNLSFSRCQVSPAALRSFQLLVAVVMPIPSTISGRGHPPYTLSGELRVLHFYTFQGCPVIGRLMQNWFFTHCRNVCTWMEQTSDISLFFWYEGSKKTSSKIWAILV